MNEPKHVIIDKVFVECTGCKKVREFETVPFLVGADALIAWMKTIEPCPCGAPTCDVKCHLVGSDPS